MQDVDLRLPSSRFEGTVRYHVSEGDVELDLDSDSLAFADVRFLSPALPERGGGRLTIRAALRDTAPSDIDITNARLASDGSRVSGNLGVTTHNRVFTLRNTDLRFTRFSSQLAERLSPGLNVRVPGTFTGRATLAGPEADMRVDVSGTYDPSAHAPFAFTARGHLGAGETVRARNLRITARGVPATLADEFGPPQRIRGTFDAQAVLSGSSASRFTGSGTLRHHDNGVTSTVSVEGDVAPADSVRMNLRVTSLDVPLAAITRNNPRVGLTGRVTGSGTISGTPRSIVSTMTLQLPAGTVDAEGRLRRVGETPFYRVSARLRDIDANAAAPRVPFTSLNGLVTVDGYGFDLATLRARVSMQLRDVVVDSAQVTDVVLLAEARDARLAVDSLRLHAPFGTATARGTIGLVEGITGTLTYQADVPTLAGLDRWIATGDTTLVYPRSLVRQRVMSRAMRADSIRREAVIASGNIDSIVRRGVSAARRGEPTRVDVTEPIARDSLSGGIALRGTVQGNVRRFTTEGQAALTHVVWGGNEIGRGALEYRWVDVGTPDAELTAELGVDSLRAAGFAFDSTHVAATYRNRTGNVTLQVFPGDTSIYRVRAAYELRADQNEVRLQDVNLKFDSVTWASTHESVVRWSGGSVAIDSLDLRTGADASAPGRILVHGELPDDDPGRLQVLVQNLRLAPWLTLLQSNLPIDGIASLNATIEGTRRSPTIRGAVALENQVFRGAAFPSARSEFEYADRRLRFEGALVRREGNVATGTAIARLTGAVPIDLRMTDAVERRMYDGAITVDVEGDSIPLGPLAQFVEGIAVIDGSARGRVGIRGSWEQPRFEGDIALAVPRLGVAATGVTLVNGIAQLRMDGDRLVIDTLSAVSGGGTIHARGTMLLERIDRPVLDVTVIANEARVLDNARGQLVVSSELDFRGQLDTLSVGGSVTVMHGALMIPEPQSLNLINTGDPALFAVVDTALARELEVGPPPPLLKNATVNVRLDVRRGTWARSADANIEVFGAVDIERRPWANEISVTGSLQTDYGTYELYGRRFAVTRGSARFTGPPTNPTLQVLATHEVAQAGRAPLIIQVTIGGTLERPNVSLESQAQPTLTQNELIAYLAFGRSSTSLLQVDGSTVDAGGMTGSSLAGNVAALATRQLAGVALGALITEIERDLIDRTAADVLNIRPADLPPGLSLGAMGTVLSGTQIEIGKYLDRHTFVVAQVRPTLAVPGATIERRFGPALRVRTSLETRYLPLRPSLTEGLRPRMQQVLAGFLIFTRSW
jgi:translocation and assembly module TamB